MVTNARHPRQIFISESLGRAADRRQMLKPALSAGLILPDMPVSSPDDGPHDLLTDQAALTPGRGEELRIEPLVAEGDPVAQGQPVAHLRAAPEVALVAPMAGRVASILLQPGRRLVQMVLFREGDDRHRFDISGQGPDALAGLMRRSGLWRALRSRPFGRMPRADETPAAIFVMAIDSRPAAPDPLIALQGRHEDFQRGLTALATLTPHLYLCGGADLALPDGVRRIRCGALHPQGLAGIQIHRHHPARIEAPVWDIHAEDVAALGALLADGMLPPTRLVSVTGAALHRARLLRCQPGADLRGLCHDITRPGPHQILAGDRIGGHAAHWLGPRDRQVSVLPRGEGRDRGHWFNAALRRAARPLPIIPTAALDQALGGDIPAAALIRALASGDSEGAVRLGALSLLEEDLALADYVTGADPTLSSQLRVLLQRIHAEEVPQ